MTADEDQREPVDGPDAGSTSQGEPGEAGSGTGSDEGREHRPDPEPAGSSNAKADDAASVDDPGAAEENL